MAQWFQWFWHIFWPVSGGSVLTRPEAAVALVCLWWFCWLSSFASLTGWNGCDGAAGCGGPDPPPVSWHCSWRDTSTPLPPHAWPQQSEVKGWINWEPKTCPWRQQGKTHPSYSLLVRTLSKILMALRTKVRTRSKGSSKCPPAAV